MPDVQMPKPIFIISDGTGETAERVVRAALVQFEGYLVYLRTFPDVQNTVDLGKLFRLARREKALVITTIVTESHRDAANQFAERYGLPHIDLFGPVLNDLGAFLESQPTEQPGMQHIADQDYFQRIEAIEFTVKADDGKNPHALRKADIVLVGISRTSKTPLSVYLAHKGYRVANVPLVLDHEPPPELWDVEAERIFALTIDPETLLEIRRERLVAMGVNHRSSYGDIAYILAELEQAHDLFSQNPDWPIIDVTNKAVEETAATILRLFQTAGLEVRDFEG